MGAKQSKRSVDISGKEAEGGGEVAAAGAGGEGRVEQLADADALKPQLNGDAHIQHEQTDKEKELDSGTPENEKDATTEKEGKEETTDKENEAVPVTNGETEPKENGESTPTPEDGKKPKKEKVKKKWSLRSISFSRKDKPKQEKKAKEEEPKTNGEPEKVPEETAEATPEAVANEVAEEAKAPTEEKDEKTPETPVTEPLTNGTSTPESKAETPATEEAAAAPSPPGPEPEHLPVNGLSLEEPKPESPEVQNVEETKPEPLAAETAEIVPAPEIPKEVCVEQMPLLEPTPPPLPANPPPSSVASFAATTMAPELTDASLANTADAAIAPLTALPDTKDVIVQPEPPTAVTVTETPDIEVPFVLKETSEAAPAAAVNIETDVQDKLIDSSSVTKVNTVDEIEVILKTDVEKIPKETPLDDVKPVVIEAADTEIESMPVLSPEVEIANKDLMQNELVNLVTPEADSIKIEAATVDTTKIEVPNAEYAKIEAPETVNDVIVSEIVASDIVINTTETALIDEVENKSELSSQEIAASVVIDAKPELENTTEPELELPSIEASEIDDLPPPPALDDVPTNIIDVDENVEESLKQIPEPIADVVEEIAESITNEMSNGMHDGTPDDLTAAKMKKKAASSAATVEANGTVECNGSAADEEVAPAEGAEPCSRHAPAEPCADRTQELLPVSDKLADLIAEVPDVPELKTETLQETVTDVAVAN